MDAKNDLQLKLPSAGKMWRIAAGVFFAMSLIAPVKNLPIWTNELRAFLGIACLLVLVDGSLRKDGLGILSLLRETSLTGIKSRIQSPLKLFGTYWIAMLLGGYLIYEFCVIMDSVSGWQSLDSFKLMHAERNLQQEQRFLNPLRMAPLWGVLKIVIFVPFVEELFFRRFLYTALRKRCGFVLSFVFVSVFFGLLHFSTPLSLAIITINGGFLGYLFEKQKDLFANTVYHGLSNLFFIFLAAARQIFL